MGKLYDTDVSDAARASLSRTFRRPDRAETALHRFPSVVNATFYLLRTGC